MLPQEWVRSFITSCSQLVTTSAQRPNHFAQKSHESRVAHPPSLLREEAQLAPQIPNPPPETPTEDQRCNSRLVAHRSATKPENLTRPLAHGRSHPLELLPRLRSQRATSLLPSPRRRLLPRKVKAKSFPSFQPVHQSVVELKRT